MEPDDTHDVNRGQTEDLPIIEEDDGLERGSVLDG